METHPDFPQNTIINTPTQPINSYVPIPSKVNLSDCFVVCRDGQFHIRT